MDGTLTHCLEVDAIDKMIQFFALIDRFLTGHLLAGYPAKRVSNPLGMSLRRL
jgi:hypothetical protein